MAARQTARQRRNLKQEATLVRCSPLSLKLVLKRDFFPAPQYVSCEDQCLFEMFGFGNHTDGSIYVDKVEEFLDMTETGHNMDENDVPANCMEASGEADYRDFFNFYADQVNYMTTLERPFG